MSNTTIQRPILTEEERKRRMKAIQTAAVKLLEERKETHEKSIVSAS